MDLDKFEEEAQRIQPKIVVMGMSMTLFPLPVKEMADIIAPWGGRFIYDGAHQAGLIVADKFKTPSRRARRSSRFGGQNVQRPAKWHDPVERPRTDRADHYRHFPNPGCHASGEPRRRRWPWPRRKCWNSGMCTWPNS